MKKVFLILLLVIICITSAFTENTLIKLKISEKVLRASPNASTPSKSLIARLPVTVKLYDSDNDFRGRNLNLDYSESNLQTWYKNGNLAFWTLRNNFVIFVKDEEISGNLVILGKIKKSQQVLDSLSGTIDVVIDLAK